MSAKRLLKDGSSILTSIYGQLSGLNFLFMLTYKCNLITSRDPLAKSMFTDRPLGLDIGSLSQQDSLSLLNYLTGIANESEDDIA